MNSKKMNALSRNYYINMHTKLKKKNLKQNKKKIKNIGWLIKQLTS